MPRKKRTNRRRRRSRKAQLKLSEHTQRSISGVLQMVIGALLYLSLRNEAGIVGEYMQQVTVFFFGSWGMIFPFFLIGSGLLHTFSDGSRFELKRSIGLVLILLSFLGMYHLQAPLDQIGPARDELAGAVGFLMSAPLLMFSSKIVGYLILGALMVISVFLAFEPDLTMMYDWLSDIVARMTSKKKKKKARRTVQDEEEEIEYEEEYEDEEDDDEEYEDDEEEGEYDENGDLIEDDQEAPELNIVRPAFAQSVVEDTTEKSIKEKVAKVKTDTLQMQDTRFEEWTFPGLDLLDQSQSELTVDDEQLKEQAKLIEEKLAEFDIDVVVRDARPGPTVTQFTLEPAEGVKLSKIANLKDDLALALAAQSLRIEAPIPGKSLVGIEMPNAIRTTVHLREILESDSFRTNESPLSLPMGRDVSGEELVASLEDMPHLLIAGATGSGKSVCMNVFLTSLLYQNAPDDLKLILIDPKRVELMPYNNIPHLLTPVITESEKALQALRWSVAEMGRRLHRFSEQGARNIDEYNEKQTDEAQIMPRIVIVVDELADLMMRQFRRDTETMIARIAQMARAVGMHLVIATQRPSVDVITGLIKANIPTRMAFRVVSAVDSRTILDSIGAEDLLGKGDMLYSNASTPKPMRIQGIFISTKEVERVINAVKIAGQGRITEEMGLDIDEEDEAGVTAATTSIDLDADDDGGDELFFEAVEVVQRTGKASASLLQRQLKVGYARAARLLDIMEEKSLIGPADGAKARKVYIGAGAA